MASRPRGKDCAAYPGVGDALIQFADPLIQIRSVEAFDGQGGRGSGSGCRLLSASRPAARLG